MKRTSRGAVLVESTIVMSASLLLLLGAGSIGLVGYSQIGSDAGAFFATRAYALELAKATQSPIEETSDLASATDVAKKIVHRMLPGFGSPTFTNVAITNAGVDASSDPGYYTQSTRHGGVSIVVPQGRQGTIRQQGGGIFSSTSASSLTGVALEPDLQLVNAEYNIGGSTQYDATGPAIKYYGTAMDQPPYYFSHNYISFCGDAVWTKSCPSGMQYRAFGVGEYLLVSNWSLPPTIAQSGTQINAFSAMLCHQRVFASAAQTLFSSTTRPTYRPGVDTPDNDKYDPLYVPPASASWSSYPASLVYGWDRSIPNGFNVDSGVTVGSMPLAPTKGCDNVLF